MEIMVKIKEGQCDYTKAQGKAFVKFSDENGGTTGWLGIEALNQAQEVLAALSPKPQPYVKPSFGMPHVAAPVPLPALDPAWVGTQPQPSLRSQVQATTTPLIDADIPGVSTEGLDVELEFGKQQVAVSLEAKKKDGPMMRAFAEDLQELVAKHSHSEDPNKKPGVPELKIKDILIRWTPRFASRENMYKVVEQTIGMTRERFNMILSTQQVMKNYQTVLERSRE